MRRGDPAVGLCLLGGRDVPCELDRLTSNLAIPEPVRNHSVSICCAVVAGRLVKRRALPVIAASSIYAACRESSTPITIRELATASNSTPKELGRCYKSIMKELQITPPIPNGAGYVNRVASKLKASGDAARISIELVKKAVEKGMGDRNPMTLAAGAVYLACLSEGEGVRQSDVAEAAGVSVWSVRECLKDLRRLGAERSGSGNRNGRGGARAPALGLNVR